MSISLDFNFFPIKKNLRRNKKVVHLFVVLRILFVGLKMTNIYAKLWIVIFYRRQGFLLNYNRGFPFSTCFFVIVSFPTTHNT